MTYLQHLTLPSVAREELYLNPGAAPGAIDVYDPDSGYYLRTKYNYDVNRTCFNSVYPFKILASKGLEQVAFSDVTIFCGGNGSGKSTLLNVIAQKLGLNRQTPYNRTVFFDDYVLLCKTQINALDDCEFNPSHDGKIITSDDVFSYSFNVREKSDSMDERRRKLFRQMDEAVIPKSIDLEDAASVLECQRASMFKKSSKSRMAKQFIGLNPVELSNGETGFQYFVDQIHPGGLYLLDEPENSLSTKLQIELKAFIEAMVRAYDCQFIIASHSPFILAIADAVIYDLDCNPVNKTEWDQIEDVIMCKQFFDEEYRRRELNA